jgi:hypothetical protein
MNTTSTHGKFEDILAMASPSLKPLCESLRSLIVALDKNYVEVVWPKQKIASFGVGPKKMTEHYVYIGLQSKHVNLGFYHGAKLKDPGGILEGTGKGLRHIKLYDVADVKNSSIKALIREAIADRKKHKDET